MKSNTVTNAIAASITTSLLVSTPLTGVLPLLPEVKVEDCLKGLRFVYRMRYSTKRTEKEMITAGCF
jgi:hypothetical protein